LDDLGFKDNSLGLLLQEVNEVRLDASVVGTGGVRDGREEDGAGGISLGDGVRVQGGKSIIPQSEQSVDFGVRDGGGSTGSERSRDVRTSLGERK